MATNLVISGGPLHDFAASTAALVDALAETAVESTVVDDPHAAFAALTAERAGWDLVTVNALWWRMPAARHADLRDRWAFAVSDDDARALDRHVRGGGGLLACHAAAICFDAHPLWLSCIGAAWNWERSSHPPLGHAFVSPTAAGSRHPLTEGVAGFTTRDEIYGFLDHAPDLVPLLTSPHGGTDHPVLWARQVGRGRVVTDLLGHDATAMSHPEHRRILQRAARWLTAADRGPAEHRDEPRERSELAP